LSREIFSGVVFGAVGLVFVVMQWRKISTFPVRRAVALLACVVGLFLVLSMSMAYMLPAMPAWNTIATPLAFFTTTFLLGALAVGAALVANYAYIQRKDPGCADAQCELVRAALRWITITAIALLGVELVVLPLQLGNHATVRAGLGGTGLEIFAGEFGSVLLIRVALAFIGAAVLGVFVYQNASSPGKERIMGTLTYAAFFLVLVAEVMGRFLFYATNPGL
jgi:anaerobic dimethyl sulfoxide reductase subunit C